VNSQKVVAQLPDPEYYFPVVSEVKDDDKRDGIRTVIIRSDENLWEQAAGYVNLLKWSGKYPVTQNYEHKFDDGDYTWHFQYNNKDEIKTPHYYQIEVKYYNKSTYSDEYAIWIIIYNTDAFELVHKERYGDETATETTTDAVSNTVSTTQSQSYFTTQSNSNSGVSGSSSSYSTYSDDSSYSNDFWEDDNDDLYDAKPICGVCNGDGDCDTCGGDGLLHSSASDEEDRNCYSCSGSGNCRSCRGSGRL